MVLKYAAHSRSLACLENVVHRTSRGLQANLKTLLIEVPDEIKIDALQAENLIRGWQAFDHMPYTQSLGDEWIKSKSSVVLKVPSAVIPEEFNYLINPEHEHFSRIKLISVEPFEFDGRLRQME